MQNYGQQGQQYQRPGSAASFAGQPAAPPVPPYGGGYQSAAPQNQSQWAAPPQNQAPTQQWSQPQQQAASGYNPNAYGTMGGGQQAPPNYPPPQQDQPPPPPPKPYHGFAAAVQQQQHQQQHQQAQAWPQQQQHNASHAHQQQGGYPVPGGAQIQQQQYNSAAPPPPSATPGGSYFPPAQAGRPISLYGAQQAGPSSNTPSAVTQPSSTVMSPNEQQPAYIPPSLSGQGVQAYMPSNTNPMPGVYVPPPPDVPAWQQAQHAPLQGGKKFRYTKPTVDPSFYAQGYQGVPSVHPHHPPPPSDQYAQSPAVSQHPQQPFGPPPPSQYTPHGNMPLQPPPPIDDQSQAQQPLNQLPNYGHTVQHQGQYQHQPAYQPPHNPSVQGQHVQHEQYQQASNMSKAYNDYAAPGASNMSKPHNDYGQGASNMSKPNNDYAGQMPAPIVQIAGGVHQFTQQPQWQPGHSQAPSSQGSLEGQQYGPLVTQDLVAPRPLTQTDTAPSNLYNQPSPQSQPVSPVVNRHSMSFASSHQTTGAGRTGSVSSIALANLHAQREGARTSSPRPPKIPTPPPPRDDKSKFSALGSGGPSDWERFGDDEIDDEEIYARKPRPAQLDSVELPARQPELPAHSSPPSTHGWPSPVSQPTLPTTTVRNDTLYQPTPPPAIAHLADRPASQASQRQFVMGDAAPAPLSISPKPIQNALNSGEGWDLPKRGTPTQTQAQHHPPSTQNAFVMDDGARTEQTQTVPARHQSPGPVPLASSSTIIADTTWGARQRTPTQEATDWSTQQTQQFAIELKAKEEVLKRQHAEFEQEQARLHAKIEQLRAQVNSAETAAADEQAISREQLEAMKATANKEKNTAIAAAKEKELTIERMKEDVEGKEHNIEERNAIISELRQQLEAEKSKEPPKITPAPKDLIPDLDPWYAGSLERFIAMLRNEAKEPVVEDKIKIFRAFTKAESDVRGIPFYDVPPAALSHDGPIASDASNMSKPSDPTRDISAVAQTGTTKSLPVKQDLKVQVPAPRAESPDEDYSPGGRPVLKRKATMPSIENISTQRHTDSSAQSTTILTPTSSVDDDSNRTPVQSPPEELSQPVYKAYVPPALFSSESTPSTHGRSASDISFHAPSTSIKSKPLDPRPTLQSNPSQPHDEIFFAAPGSSASKPTKSTSRPTTSDSTAREVSVPAPLAFASARSVSTAPPSRKDTTQALADLLPSSSAPPATNHAIKEGRSKLEPFEDDSSNLAQLTQDWEKTAAVIRKKLDSARRARQEENEEDNNDAFDNNEISYAALNVLEDEFKQKENSLKAQEDRDEYKSYVEAVFDKVYDTLQADIKALMDLYIEVENLLHTSVSGVKSLDPVNDAPSTQAALELLQDVHKYILTRQDAVVAAVAERDKRYKKTETTPLYAAGNITKMRAVEKHFDNAEKQALVRALRDKAGKAGELVTVAEEVVVNAVGVEQREIDAILDAIRDLDDGIADTDLLSRAQDTLSHLKTSSKSLLRIFNTIEIAHNTAVLDAEIAHAKAEGADAARIIQLEEEKAKGEKKFMDEYNRRVEVIEQDGGEIAELVKSKTKRDEEEVERERRLKAALEEAKRRNGEA